jgi:hypothetical protein
LYNEEVIFVKRPLIFFALLHFPDLSGARTLQRVALGDVYLDVDEVVSLVQLENRSNTADHYQKKYY